MLAKSQYKDHVIVCGYGMVGERIVEILLQAGIKIVVIEIDKAKGDMLKGRELDFLIGDATSSMTLKAAGIEKAQAIAVVMDDDAKNLFAVITAKSLNPDILIATRANNEFIKGKLIEIGAKYVATPNYSTSEELLREIEKKA